MLTSQISFFSVLRRGGIPLLFLSFDYKHHEKADFDFCGLSSARRRTGSCLRKDAL
jgi:hypothetical protein